MNSQPQRVLRVVGVLCCLLTLLSISGCSCWKDPLARNKEDKADAPKKPKTLEEMQARREELEEKADFKTERLFVLPTDDSPASNKVKAGHWFNAVQTMKANAFDFPKGELEAQCISSSVKPLRLPGTKFHLNSTRPVNLPKGQTKHFDLLLHASPTNGVINFISRLRPKGGGREVDWAPGAASKMKMFQNHLVVLSDRPDNYQFVKTLRSVKPVRSDDELFNEAFDYFVKLPKSTRRIDLPSHPMAWTTTAYVLWDDFDPEIMTAEQQQAMIDWLHWGGHLVINGPQTLDKLKSSAFSDLLPANSGTVSKVTSSQVDELNENWSFLDEQEARTLELADAEEERPIALELELTDGSRFVPDTGQLVAEKRVGRGRIVATAFNIPHTFFTKWDSFDSFFNSCLLGRPRRRFIPDLNNNGITEDWYGVGRSVGRDDPRLTSSVRYFSRDASSITNRTRPSKTPIRGTLTDGPMVELAASTRRQRLRRFYNARVRSLSPRPRAQIRLVGSEVVGAGEQAKYTIEVTNSGSTRLDSGVIVFESDSKLRPVQGTDGFTYDLDGRRLSWVMNAMMPAKSISVEVLCEATNDANRSVSDLQVEFKSSQTRRVTDSLAVEIGSTNVRHTMATVANHAFGVQGFSASDEMGVAGWNDLSSISQEASKSLSFAAGISVPAKSFVAKVIGLYLLILVPLNWVIFRLMRRVEWAWAAVPLISIGGAIGVVRAAQLDIGFVRSRTEVAIVEMHPDYERAHVTRYIGFYTSLSSDYEIMSENESTLIQPLYDDDSQVRETRPSTLHQGSGIRLSGFDVTSNSTGLIHAEQMKNMGGTIALSLDGVQETIANNSDHDLKGVAVVRRNPGLDVEVAWIGDLEKKGRTSGLDFEPLVTANLGFPEWEENGSTSVATLEGDLNIRRLMEIASDPKRLGPNETILVGWSDQLLEGIEAKPRATQVTARTLFVVQLQHADRPDPLRDENCFAVLDRRMKASEDESVLP